MKGFVYTLLVFILFMAIITIAFTFISIYSESYRRASLEAGSESIEEALNSLISNANSFGSFSLSKALNALLNYTYSNKVAIPSPSSSIACLMQNGSLSPGSPSLSTLKNAFFRDYNSSIVYFLLRRFINATILQNSLYVFQDSPFSLKASYIERAILSFYGQTIVDYGIPVTASISLNGSLDPLFLMNGIYRRINFASSNFTAASYWYGTSGNGYVFAPFYYAGEQPTCNSINAFIPSSVVANQVVIVAKNAQYITNSTCTVANNFAGLVTSSITNAPSVPYVIIPSTSSFYSSFANAQKFLLVGASPVNSSFHAVVDISNLRNALYNNLYFTSPSAPSYLQRFSNLKNTSTFGIFSFYGLSHKDTIDYKYFTYTTQPPLFEVLGMPNCENSTICSSSSFPHFCLDNQTMVNQFGQLTTTLQYFNIQNIVTTGCP